MVDGEEGMSTATHGTTSVVLGSLRWCLGKIGGGVRKLLAWVIEETKDVELGFGLMAEIGKLWCSPRGLQWREVEELPRPGNGVVECGRGSGARALAFGRPRCRSDKRRRTCGWF